MHENKFCDGNCLCNSAPKVEKEKEILNEMYNIYTQLASAITFITAREEHLRGCGFIELGMCVEKLKFLVEVKYNLDSWGQQKL